MAGASAENHKDDAAAPDAAQQPKKKTDLLGMIIVLLAVVNLGALAGMGFFLQKMWAKVQEVKEIASRPAPVAVDAHGGEPQIGKELQVQSLGILYPLESFLVNITSENGSKFLQVQMELELSEPTLEDEVSRKKAAIRDSIIVLLSGRSFKELREPTGMKKLRQDLLKALNNLLATGKIKDIYFTQFHFN